MASQTLQNTGERMLRTVDGLKRELVTIRSGHATPALIEHIKVDYAGVAIPLNQIAGISAPEARLLTIQPWDKSSLRSIEKAIQTSDLGLNPVSDGNLIRIKIPPLSEERRQDLVKLVRKRVEERRIAIRNLRHEAMAELEKLKENKALSQDEYKHFLSQLQKLTDNYIAQAEQAGQDKEAELKQV